MTTGQAPAGPFVNDETGLDIRIGKNLPHIAITAADGTVTRYVEIGAHLALMDERDELRRVLALINALRREYQDTRMWREGMLEGFEERLTKLLAMVGETDASGDAMRDLVASFRRGDLRSRATEPTAVGDA